MAALIGLVAVSAIGLAALKAATQPWADALNAMTAILLATSALCALVGRGRVFWTGFGVFGWSYVIFYILFRLFASINEDNAVYPVDRLLSFVYFRLRTSRESEADVFVFQDIGHCLACLFFALGGAILARAIAPRDA